MSQQEAWVPDEVDEEAPSAARLYDYLLGGAHNFEVDRALARKFLTVLPSARDVARLNRSFMRRAVSYMVEQGVRQFLDIGSGIPTVGNVHEVAQQAAPESTVVYVDYEPVAVAHSRLLLSDNPRACIVQADMLEPDSILGHPDTRAMLDFSQPIGLLTVAALHFVAPERDPQGMLGRYRDALAPGSFLALSHATTDISPEAMAEVVEIMSRSADPVYPRPRSEVELMFSGFDLVEPGIVGTAYWRPDGPPGEDGEIDTQAGDQVYAGVGRKP